MRRKSVQTAICAPSPVGAAWVVALTTACVVGLASSPARAGNTVHPRTPVQWPEGACMRTIDRSVDPIFHVDYEIPFEDTNLTSDELPDSRRHQFLALCRQYDRQTGLPTYVSEDDLARTIAADLADPAIDDEPDATLERTEAWDGCWQRINADDARLPITFASANSGIDWDTTSVEPGVYQLVGHTFEPPVNLWRLAPYVVRVTDGQDDDIGPAAVLPDVPQVVDHDAKVTLDPCVSAPAGSELRVMWALAEPDPSFEVVETKAHDGGDVTLSFEPPPPSWGQGILVAIEVADPAGRTYRTHARQEVIVIAPPTGDGDGDGDDGEGDDDGGPTAEGGTDAVPGCSMNPEGENTPPLLTLTTIFMLGAGGARRRSVGVNRPPAGEKDESR